MKTPKLNKPIIVELDSVYREPFRIGFLQPGDCLWIGTYPDASMRSVKRWRYATSAEAQAFEGRRARHPISAGPAFLRSFDGLDPVPEPAAKKSSSGP